MKTEITQKHTPLPELLSDNCALVFIKGTGETFCHCMGRDVVSMAAGIVKAVNNHQRLVDALKGLHDELNRMARLHSVVDQALAYNGINEKMQSCKKLLKELE